MRKWLTKICFALVNPVSIFFIFVTILGFLPRITQLWRIGGNHNMMDFYGCIFLMIFFIVMEFLVAYSFVSDYIENENPVER
jgi:hypothetical protein